MKANGDHADQTGQRVNHDLPTSNGYGTQGTSKNGFIRVDVYCGRCKASYPATRAWAVRYFAVVKKEVERQITKGYATRGTLVDLEDEKAGILAWIKSQRSA
jgi:hypothetical protein